MKKVKIAVFVVLVLIGVLGVEVASQASTIVDYRET